VQKRIVPDVKRADQGQDALQDRTAKCFDRKGNPEDDRQAKAKIERDQHDNFITISGWKRNPCQCTRKIPDTQFPPPCFPGTYDLISIKE